VTALDDRPEAPLVATDMGDVELLDDLAVLFVTRFRTEIRAMPDGPARRLALDLVNAYAAGLDRLRVDRAARHTTGAA
jgi:hypothetical protein